MTRQGKLFFAAGAFAAALCTLAGIATAESRAETPIADMEDHYAIASADFGEGQVQIHSRHNSDAGSTHKVHLINCVDQTYKTVFEGDAPPETFPVDEPVDGLERLESGSANVPIAKHACDKHGLPIVELRW
jgi:hypothetical protein